ncbi:MAG: A/G-specific adenine glycosylase [Lachnospiraceae bacterium]|nr:A/G-specific adenine glycosylase [Lachnospiraceae bacterium]
MLQNYDLNRLTEPLLFWYASHARVLPWREDVTPYRIWVSEIMLQQTRVEAVKPYFNRFVGELPSVQALAECEEDRLLKLWEGLGYYNRVRNMQEAARTVMSDYGGCLPADYKALLSLKGIGRYTAGAIASIAFNLPVPAVDGNVLRVLMRAAANDADIARPATRSEAERLLAGVIPDGHASEYNQALMELGATVCLPNGEPLCHECPWLSLCEAKRQGIVTQLPVKQKQKARRCEDRTVLILRDDSRIALNKRPDRGLLAGMYELPNRTGHLTGDEVVREVEQMNLRPLRVTRLEDAVHIFSHVEWHLTGYLVEIDPLTINEADLLFVEVEDARDKYPIPAAFSAYIKYLV